MAIGVIGNDETNKLLISKENKYFDSTFKLNFKDTNESHSIICQNIAPNSKVLDIGCAQGLIGDYIHNELNCEVYGIELDKKSIKIAEETKAYKQLYNFDICAVDSKEYQEFFKNNNKFDYIIFADVLEHLYDPASVVYSFGKLLNKSGKIITSLPNIAHFDIINGLLNEKFNYSSMGLLDNTHIRFFTKYSFAEYIKEANKYYDYCFDLELVGQTIIKNDFEEKYKYLSKYIDFNKNLHVLQNIFVLPKLETNKTPKLDSILAEERINITSELNDSLQYKEQYEKLSEDYNDLISNFDYIYGEYTKMINSRSWKITKLLRIAKKIKEELILKVKTKNNSNQSILYFIHSWIDINNKSVTNIGGTTLHLLDIINNIKETKNIYVVTIYNNRYMLVKVDKNGQKIYDLNIKTKVKNFDGYDFDFLYMMRKLIDILNIDLIHIHHIIGFPCDLEFLTKEKQTIFTIHDYTLLCPRYFLLDKNNSYCKKRQDQKCLRCHNRVNYSVRNNAVTNILKNVKTLIVPDESIVKEISKYYDIANVKIISHGIDKKDFEKFDFCDKNIKHKKIKNIAFIGVIDEKKGAYIIEKVIKESPEYLFHFYGWSTNSSLNQTKNNLVYHGIYNKKELPKLLNDDNIDLILSLSVCPETFSYVLSETLYAKIPSLSYDIGAIGNRITQNSTGEVLSLDSSVRDIKKKIEEMLSDNNYEKYIKNIEKTKINSIEDMVNDVLEIYNESYIPKEKNIYEVEKELNNFYLKYKYRRL